MKWTMGRIFGLGNGITQIAIIGVFQGLLQQPFDSGFWASVVLSSFSFGVFAHAMLAPYVDSLDETGEEKKAHV